MSMTSVKLLAILPLPIAPAMMPTRVMPICTVERKRLGDSERARAFRDGGFVAW